MADNNSILETESESLMGIPWLVSLRQAPARSIYRCDGRSPRYILHARLRVVGLAMLNYCVFDCRSTAHYFINDLLSSYCCLAHTHC